MKLCLILTCALLLCTEAKVKHRDLGLTLCSETFGEYIYGLDGEEKGHVDFKLKKGVMTLPQFADPASYPEGEYEAAAAEVGICKQNLAVCKEAYNDPAEPKDAPHSSLYSKYKVQLGSENTLICHITGFYPAPVGVSWTRNNVNVTDEASLSRYYLTNDGAFNLVSRLSFTPEEGDIYTCTVEHVALERPQTKTWNVKVALPGVGASVFCGVGLAAGLLGVAVGTFFLVKGNNCK
ncbi:H-2 class II histocompatibility antigen, A-U alpha chain-like [Astyanax mexicanus]|uniref:H-2 class II histocompatibility antigen, A-U alpha chain-like n=1 Tax=Astyanax mexicanus TaxID=7994 RepID=UPI0020CB2AF9|nr:H-2 class II histocompatibility antigen, A-U alpha chain-like [Astyanax mexicanus]